jgi:uncharacterized protein YhaN
MLIKSINIEKYKKIAKKKLLFAKGLNVVLGHNEAGKSTLSSALLDGLFLNSTAKTKDVKAMKAWHQEEFGILDLEMVLNGKGLRLYKNFESGILRLTDEEGNLMLDDQKKLNQLFKDNTGISSSGMYVNTAHIAQNDVALIKTDADLLDAVQSVAAESSGSISLKKIIKSVENRIKEIEKGRGKLTMNKGILAQLESDLEKLEAKIEGKQEGKDFLQSRQSELLKVEERVAKLEPEIKSLEEFIAINEGILKAKDESELLNKELDNIEKKLDRLRGLQIDDAEGPDLEMANKDLGYLQDKGKKFSKYGNLKWPLLIVGIVLALISLIISENILLLLAIVLIAVGFLIVFLDGKEKQERDRILRKWKCKDLTELEQLLFNASKTQQKLSERSGILMGESQESLERRRKELYKKINGLELQYLTPQMLKLELSSKDYYLKLKEVENNKKELEKLKNKKIELRTILSNKIQDPSNIEDLVEQKEEIEQEIKYWEEKNEVSKVVLEGLEYSLTKTAENFKDKSSKFISQNLSKLTQGRYSKVKIGRDLSVQVYSDEKQDWVEDINELSKGTVDQIFFVIRLAFFTMLHKNEFMPLILDDPFTGYDELRLKAVKELLLELSKDIQILLFTHNPRYRDWGNTIELA